MVPHCWKKCRDLTRPRDPQSWRVRRHWRRSVLPPLRREDTLLWPPSVRSFLCRKGQGETRYHTVFTTKALVVATFVPFFNGSERPSLTTRLEASLVHTLEPRSTNREATQHISRNGIVNDLNASVNRAPLHSSHLSTHPVETVPLAKDPTCMQRDAKLEESKAGAAATSTAARPTWGIGAGPDWPSLASAPPPPPTAAAKPAAGSPSGTGDKEDDDDADDDSPGTAPSARPWELL